MLVLYGILVVCTLALVGVAAAVYLRVRRDMQRRASDTALRVALREIEEEREPTRP